MAFGVDLFSNPLLILSLTKEYLLPIFFSEQKWEQWQHRLYFSYKSKNKSGESLIIRYPDIRMFVSMLLSQLQVSSYTLSFKTQETCVNKIKGARIESKS
jgi:hypothetical protein